MPQGSDLTIKKADGSTNIVWAYVSPSSGDKTPAVWKSQSVGTAPAFQPEFRLSARDVVVEKVPSRALRGTIMYPQLKTDTTTGVTSVHRTGRAMFDFTFARDMAAVDVNELAAQLGGLISAAVIQACLKSGYSAT